MLSVKLDAPAPCRLDAPDLDLICYASADCLHQHERNLLEIERDDLHGISRLTKKRELDSRIERKNEEIDILKSGLSGIVKRYGFDTVQQFYNAIKIAQDATYKYQMDVATWEENYGEKTPPKATFEERLRIYQREADQQHTQRNYHSRDKGAR